MKLITNQKKAVMFFMSIMAFAFLKAQNVDEKYAALIKKHTTDKRFLPNSMKTFPASSEIPSPLEHFGAIIGAPGVMHHTKDIYDYYKIVSV